MKPAVEAVSKRIDLDWNLSLSKQQAKNFDGFWKSRRYRLIPPEVFEHKKIWLEVGAGSGAFAVETAKLHSDVQVIAIERCKERGGRLVRKSQKSGAPNLIAYKANAIPALINCVPDGALERLYILYPPPWPRNNRRKQRWYLHPVMEHFIRILKPGGLLVWASDQKFYIDEAAYVCERLGLKTLVHSELQPNHFNELQAFPGGRSKFEKTFLDQNLPCYELIVQKS